MKRINKILNVLILLIVTILLLLYFELKQDNKFLSLEIKETFDVKYSEDSNRSDMLDMLENLASKHNVVLGKSKFNSKYRNIYLSLKNENIKEYLNNYFDIKEVRDSNKCYVSTYINDSNQCGLIKDLFNNTKYNYYSFNNLKQNNDSIFGSYFLYYKDYSDLQNFQDELNSLLGYNSYSNSYIGDTSNYVLIVILLIIVILSIFNFVFQLYYSYKKLYKIGCLKLLGFNIKETIKNIYKNNSLIIIIISIIFLFLLTFISLQKVTGMIKVLLSIILIITLSSSYNAISNLNNSLKDYKASKNLLGYGVLDGLLGDPIDHM